MNDLEQIDYTTLQQQVRERRSALGIGEVDDVACRNSGGRRTAEKRAMLSRIEERCRAAGVEPLWTPDPIETDFG